jgi:hypothetical protein
MFGNLPSSYHLMMRNGGGAATTGGTPAQVPLESGIEVWHCFPSVAIIYFRKCNILGVQSGTF